MAGKEHMELSNGSIQLLNDIFRRADREGRRVLYEHEVYGILEIMGLEVPRFVFVDDPSRIDDRLLEAFGGKLVIKVVSSQIAHKQKLGGVKVIEKSGALFARFVIARMREEILQRFPGEAKPEIDGFLLVEYVPHTQALGCELLAGLRDDPAFGPVVTLSKGGEDAEFFARNYDPACHFVGPLDYSQARRMIDAIKIKEKYFDSGHPEYMEHIAGAMSRMSELAQVFSFTAARRQEYFLKALDVNPFVFTADHRFVAVDGFAEFSPAGEEAGYAGGNNLSNLDGFFKPDGIAVVGVSSDFSKPSVGREVAKLLEDQGREDLFFVNPRGGSIFINGKEYPLYGSCRELPAKVDLVIYAAPGAHMVDFAEELKACVPKALILISGVPASINYGEFMKRLRDTLPAGLRVIGPNGMGVCYTSGIQGKGVNTLFMEENRMAVVKHSERSNTVLLTQSGGIAITCIDKFSRGRILRSVVSFGNKFDVKASDLVAYFNRDKDIRLIALYVEGLDIGEGRQFFDICRQADKPVVVYKAGKTEAGAKAAASHTASMSGSYDVFKAACRQAGVVLAENVEDLYDYIQAFAQMAGRKPVGNRVAGVVNSGFESTAGADELRFLEQAQLAPATVGRIKEINKHGLVDTSSPILDITAMSDDRMYADFVEAVIQDDNVDCVFVSVIPHVSAVKTIPENCRDADGLANLLVGLFHKYNKPMVVSVNAGEYYQEFVSIMQKEGLPVYTDIRAAVKSLDIFAAYHVQRMTGKDIDKTESEEREIYG